MTALALPPATSSKSGLARVLHAATNRSKATDTADLEIYTLVRDVRLLAVNLRVAGQYLLGLVFVFGAQVENLEGRVSEIVGFFTNETKVSRSSTSKRRKTMSTVASDSQSLAPVSPLPALPSTPSRTPSVFSMRMTPNEDDQVFGELEGEPDDLLNEEFRKRPRMSLLSEVLDDLRGDEGGRRISDQIGWEGDWNDMASEGTVQEKPGNLRPKKNIKVQLSRKIINELKQPQIVRPADFRFKISNFSLLPDFGNQIPVNDKTPKKQRKSIDSEICTPPPWLEEQPDWGDENVESINTPYKSRTLPTPGRNSVAGLGDLTLLEAASKAKPNPGRTTISRFFIDLLALKATGEVDLQFEINAGFLAPQHIGIQRQRARVN